jgi:asparagine synthase (glutamine-hydrolysing)
MTSAVEAYRKALVDAMGKRVQDFQRIGIIFSGGIDSVLIAYLAAKMVPEVICYTGGVTGSSDIVYARQIADRLGLKLKVCELDQEGVERLIPEVMNVIEDSNAGQVEVALPVYGAVKLAHEDGIKVMLTGQGADELFGGYSWYAKVVEKEGYKMLRRHMIEDLLLLYKETLEREDKITMAHSIELREPFLDPEVIKVALATSLRLNVRDGGDSFGKHVHRKLAEAVGIPKDISYRIKEAAQHGSGMHGMLDAIARKHGFDDSTIPLIYLEELKMREKIGSSQRYGYLFGDGKIWIAEPHMQMFLDSILKKMARFELMATQ